ncbi:MAG: sigma-70 family RNA polymerase sigma factor [Lachnospiraceae bacterium]|nr:sigma-70 family RNA polymerase sigma factor [Lachnospiraceae bacterium]
MKITEENYVDQLQKHNEKALRYVMECYGGLLRGIIRKKLHAFLELQEECLDDVFLNIWNHADCYDPSKSSFKNWAAAIAVYRAIDYQRKQIRMLDTVALDEASAGAWEEPLTAEKQELSEEVELLLSSLNPKDRQLFYDLYVEELDIEEVSSRHKMSKDRIYNHISRGKKKLRSRFQQERS